VSERENFRRITSSCHRAESDSKERVGPRRAREKARDYKSEGTDERVTEMVTVGWLR